MWAETKPNRIFEESLFWIQTRSIGCNYCMGQFKMLPEVAGLNKEEIAERTRRLARVRLVGLSLRPNNAPTRYARKLSKTPLGS